ncbi:MAG: SCP2 sterol-binding domain-containing protein [Pseudomonadota bacterium]
MSEKLDTALAKLNERLAGRSFEDTVKFDIENAGVIRIVDGAATAEDGPADCTVTASIDTFEEMFAGDLDPTAAFMTGKIKIDGDMGVAMKLGQILA